MFSSQGGNCPADAEYPSWERSGPSVDKGKRKDVVVTLRLPRFDGHGACVLRRKNKQYLGVGYSYWHLCETMRTARGLRQRVAASLGTTWQTTCLAQGVDLERKHGRVIKILIVEDQAMLRDMLTQVCRQNLPEVELHPVTGGNEAREICGRIKPDLLLLDLGLPDVDGLELVEEFTASLPQLKIIILSGYVDEFTIHRVMSARVQGFLDKNEQPLHMFPKVMVDVLAGGYYLSPVAQRIHSRLRSDPHAFTKVLSEREQRLLTLMGRGMSNEELAELYGLSVHTIKIHRRNIMGKLELHSTPRLIQYAIEKGFVRYGRGPLAPERSLK